MTERASQIGRGRPLDDVRLRRDAQRQRPVEQQIGDGLDMDAQRRIKVKAGDGLTVAPDGSVSVVVKNGGGLQLQPGSPLGLALSDQLISALLAPGRTIGAANPLVAKSELTTSTDLLRLLVLLNGVAVGSGQRIDFVDGLNSTAVVTWDSSSEKFVVSVDVTGAAFADTDQNILATQIFGY
jgi:hypothetical protein